MTRKWGEHPNDGKGLERVSAALKAEGSSNEKGYRDDPEMVEWLWRWIDRMASGQHSVGECLSVLTYHPDAPPWVTKRSSEPRSSDETSGKPMPCWCPYCGEPHGVHQAETDPRGTGCQHDRFKPGLTLQWLGSTPDIRANTHRFQCMICRETFDLAIGEAQLSSAVKAKGCPIHGRLACGDCDWPPPQNG